MIAHEVNNTTAGITSTLDTVEQALSTEEGMDDICDVMRVCTERCFSMSRFITRFADVVKIPEPTLTLVDLNDLAFTCKRFMEGMCTDRNIKLRLEIDENAERGKNGCLPLRTGIGKHHQECCGKHREGWRDYRPPPSPAIVEVVDNGKGISKEVEAKLFSRSSPPSPMVRNRTVLSG